MEHWGRRAKTARPAAEGDATAATGPEPVAPRARSADQASGEAGHSLKGFGGAFRSVVGRKLRELRGQRWEGATDRQRMAEANRRAADEMARRIERETGRRPSAATVRRNARQDKLPRGVDPARMDRQSRIDDAGGLKQFAQQAGVHENAARRWKDTGGLMSTASVQVLTDVDGWLRARSPFGTSESYERDLNDVSLQFDPPAADELRAAHAVEDWDGLAELLGPAITRQYPWIGEADRYYEVTTIRSIELTDL